MSIKKMNLLASTALVAAILVTPGLAFAQAIELDVGMPDITASDANGLAETDGAGAAIAVTIDSAAGTITLGADATPSIANTEGTNADPVTVTVTSSGTANGVIFAGDVVTGANGGDTITIESTTDDLTFQGNITEGSGAIDIVMGNGGTADLAVTFDNAFGEALTINATIDAAHADDTVTMNVTNTEGSARTIGFTEAIGGNVAIDVLNVSADTEATFSSTVAADEINISSTNTTTFTGAVTGDINLAADGTAVVTAGVSGDVDNTTGTASRGTLELGAGADVGGDVGATAALKAVSANTTGDTVFGGVVNATTITLTNNGTVDFNGDVTGAITTSGTGYITIAADKKIVGSIDKTGGVAGGVIFAANTADIVLVSGNVGATSGFVDVTTNAAAATTATFGGTVKATTVALSGAGTTAVQDDVTGTVSFLTDGYATFAANKKIVGNLNTDGTDIGTVTFAATTANTTLVSGTVGAGAGSVKAVNVAPASGVTATFTGAYDALTTTHSGAGTVAFGSTVAGDIDISAGGAVTAADDMTGAVDNTGTAGTGSLTLAATKGVSGAIGTTAALASVTADSTGGTSTFGGIVKATNISLGGTGTTIFQGDVTGAVNFTADGGANLTANEKIVGSVTTETDETGTLSFDATTTNTTLVSGDIGTTTKKLKDLDATANAATTATFGGNVYAKTITLTGAAASSQFTFSGDIEATTLDLVTNGTINVAAGKNVTADVTTSAPGAGVLTFAGTSTMTGDVGEVGGNAFAAVSINGGTVTFTGDVAATAIGVANGTTLKTGGAAAFEGAITNAGTLDLGGTLTVTGGTLELGSDATVNMTLATASSYTGGLVIDASAVTTNATNAITVAPHASFRSGALTLIDTDGVGTADAVGKYTITDQALATYAVTVDANDDVILTATAKSNATVAAEIGINAEQAKALIAAVDATESDATLAAAYDAALKAGGADAIKAAEQSEPGFGGTAEAMAGAARSFAGAVGDRMSSARTGTQVAGLSTSNGVAAGEKGLRNGAWSKVFGGTAEQKNLKGFSGYDLASYGVALGADNKVSDTVRLGLAGSYARSDIDGKGSAKAKTDINAYQLALYGAYEPGRYYIEGQLAYAFNQIDTKRTINFGGLDRRAKGDYDAHQFSASLGAGLPMTSGAYTFTPKAGLFYSYMNADSYTETGAGGLNMTVDPGNSSILEGSLGGSIAYDKKTAKGLLRPEVRAAVLYEFLDDDASVASKYAGSATTFTTKEMDPSRLGGTAGVGLGYKTADGKWDVRIDYDAELREKYVGHNGMLTGRMNF